MSYIALYREWRPQTFADMVGQEHVTRTLQNALRTGRFAHAYLFSGPRGTGKTSSAKILAKAINCENGPTDEPCNDCPACRGITVGSIMDVVEIDAASNRGVDEIRDLREQVKYAPTEVRYKVYIVDEVHMLTTEAFNALLKTLEEPPRHVVFILATTEPHKLPATIISRCQRFDFRRITAQQTVERLRLIANEKKIAAEEDALWMVARAAEGGMRDALSIFDQVISFGGEKVTADTVVSLVGGVRSDILASIARSVAEKDVQQVLRTTEELIENGKEPGQILHDLTGYFRDLLMYKTVPGLEEIQDRIQYDKLFVETADLYSDSKLIAMIDQMTQTAQEMKWHAQGRLLLEMLMVRLCQTEAADVKELLRRIERLERKLAEGVPIAAVRSAAAPANPVSTNPGKPASQPRTPSAPEKSVSTQTAAENKTASVSAPTAKPVDKLIKNPSKELFEKLNAGWNQILDEIKRRKITAQAWLLDGEAVAFDSGNVIVAFKNQIHRDTVMKPIHKTVIDEVLSEYMGQSCSLVAVLQSEWQQFKQQGTAELASTSEDQFVKEVIDLFGQEIVEIEE
ncbi:DNA polymerase III subunit gamma/tau [Effusibacillus lacus]|uniref:DNA-directed DNA polymerase n=1 Tax=Effusibacillus lacus TaxID=1348429 RepID=A0A292YFE2_9BACL|nr:DNA polymerase III subunit gamma/tau [Effusibacillus lacus]TCS74421.1 DNA polymerase-3 subunit gamma/tau [Effusibacillus lacus]GAX88707.1 DNA polymerase III subunit gamma/tau [Effusibacillus lacus]